MKNLLKLKSNSIIFKLIVIPVVLILGACSTTYTPESDVNLTYDFESVKSYSVVGDEHLRNPLISDIDRERIDSAIDSSMQQRGKFEVTQNKADILISYFVVTKDKTKVNAYYSGGYGHNCYRCDYGYGGGVSHISTRDYVEGTLVLDVIDSDSQRSVYRSTLTKPLESYETPQERQQAITEAINDMMKQMPLS